MFISFLKVFFCIWLIWILYVIVDTASHNSLIQQWGMLASVAWMKATLWDFYANMMPLILWVNYKESTWPKRIVWTLLLVSLGSIATCIYILIQLFQPHDDDGFEKLLVHKNH
jgi:hypothetical protein